MQLIEYVPNFSEGNDLNIIKQITDEIEKVEDVRLLNVDTGKASYCCWRGRQQHLIA